MQQAPPLYPPGLGYPAQAANGPAAAAATATGTVPPIGGLGQPPADINSEEYKAWYAAWYAMSQAAVLQQQQQQQWYYQQMMQRQQLQQQHLMNMASRSAAASPQPQTKAAPMKEAAVKKTTSQFAASSNSAHLEDVASLTFKKEPMYVPIKASGPSPVAAESAPPKEEKRTGWPESLKKYVAKVFALCKPETREVVEKQLKELIAGISSKNALYDTDWDKMDLPPLCQQEAQPTAVKPMTMFRTQTPNLTTPMQPQPSASPTLSKLAKMNINNKKRKAMAALEQEAAVDGNGATSQDALTHLPPRLRDEELERRRMREMRFKEAEERQKQRLAQQKKGVARAQRLALLAGAEGNPDVIDWDEHTIVGVSEKLEKPYLRLTSAPDPSAVRPLRVLKKTLELLNQKWSIDNYTYICDQFKSMRQDLTVQRIKNDFTVKVYETHARYALLKGDLGEYNQCQAQLKELYRLGLPGAKDEFLNYRILYLIYIRNRSELVKILSELTPDEKSGPSVRHALSVRRAIATGDYHSLFKLYLTAPNLSSHILDAFLHLERLRAARALCRAYRPTLAVEFIARELGFCGGGDEKGVRECFAWLRGLGLPLASDGLLDAKSAVGVVAARLAEAESKGVDLKGQLSR